MAREWQAGDVAMVEAGCWANRKIALRLDEGWSHINGVSQYGDSDRWSKYTDIKAVRILSDGVTA